MNYWREFAKGLWSRNPVLVAGLGFCPALAVTCSVENALWMSIAAACVLIATNTVVSGTRKFVPENIRLIFFIIVIATFVTAAELVLKARVPAVSADLGIYLPLMMVGCVFLGRAGEFACRNGVVASILDALGMGLGFGLVLCILALVRESFGANTFFGHTLIPGMEPARAMLTAPGAFLTLAMLLWAMNAVKSWKRR